MYCSSISKIIEKTIFSSNYFVRCDICYFLKRLPQDLIKCVTKCVTNRLILTYKKIQQSYINSLIRLFIALCCIFKTLYKSIRGAGGIRTLVQTRKPYAFYTLISALGFRVKARPEP